MSNSIFVESSETLGIFYDRYRKLPGKIGDFMDDLDDTLDTAEKKEVSEEKAKELIRKLEKFKQDVEMDLKTPDPIDADDIKSTRESVQHVKNSCLKILDRLGTMRRKYRFGENWIKGIFIKPKIYKNSIDEDDQIKVNQMMRSIGRAMDWVEKIDLELMNLADQDLNILSLVQKVYFRKIYESPDDVIQDILNESVFGEEEVYESFFSDGKEDSEPPEDEENSLLDVKIPSTQEFFPVYSIVTSYDQSNVDNLNELQKRMIDRGKMIGAITRGDVYTHTLVSFDTSLENMFHFMGSGFEPDSILTNPTFEITRSVYINCTFVTKEERQTIFDEVKKYSDNKPETEYAMLQLIDQLFGKTLHHDKRMICSTFVGYLLSCGNVKNLHRDYSLIRPEDITILPRSFYIINFKDKEDFLKRKNEFDQRVAKVYNDNIEEIRDYNNVLPKVMLKSKFQETKGFEKFFDWIVKKLNITA